MCDGGGAGEARLGPHGPGRVALRLFSPQREVVLHSHCGRGGARARSRPPPTTVRVQARLPGGGLVFSCIPTRTTERVLRPATWLAVALPRPSPRPALACSAPHGAAPPPHSHVRGLSCLLAESGANPFLPPEPGPGAASPLCSRPPSVPRAPPARPPTSVCRCARVSAVHWRGRRRGSASGAARAKGGPHVSWAGFRHFADDYRACVVSVVRVCLLVGAWSVGFFSEVSGGRLLVCGLFWLRGGGGGGVFMICLVRGGACVWFRGEAGGC